MCWLRNLSLLFAISATIVLSADGDQNAYKVVCYLGSWANYKTGDAKYLIEDIDPFLCTHVIYSFAKLENNQIASHDPHLDLKANYGLGAYERFNNLKKKNPQLKTLIAIGGWNEGSKKYSAMAADAGSRAAFVNSVIKFCKTHNFDGLDVDWEYPGNRGGAPHDKQNFVILLKELKEAFQPHGLLLSAAVAAGKNIIDTAYDIPRVSKYLDFINVMAYDLHGHWEKKTGHNAPLYARDDDTDKILNVDYAIQYWIKQGADRKKLILGMGLYGKSFTLADQGKHGLGAPATGPGIAGEMTQEPGKLGYNEICLKIAKEGWNEVFVPKIESPYAYHSNQWVGFDNKESIAIKVDYLIKNGLGGAMVWSLETDDFRGKCFGEKYPLLSTIVSKLNQKQIVMQTVPPEEQVTRKPEVKTTVHPGGIFKCSKEGFFRDPSDCSKFYHCVAQGNMKFRRHHHSCGPNTAFDEVTKTCTFKHNVPGCED